MPDDVMGWVVFALAVLVLMFLVFRVGPLASVVTGQTVAADGTVKKAA